VAWWLRNGGSWTGDSNTPTTWEQTLEAKKALATTPPTLEKTPDNMFRIKLAMFIKNGYTLGYTDTPQYDTISKFFSETPAQKTK